MRNIILAVSSLILLAGCASGGKSVKGKTAPQTKKYIEKMEGSSASKKSVSSGENCSPAKVWKKATWQRQIKIANACVTRQKWKRVKTIGQHMAKFEHASPWGPYFISLVADAEKDYERALWMVNLSLKKAPKMGLLHYQKGRILWNTKKNVEAIESFEIALDLDEGLTDIHRLLGQVYHKDQEYSKSIKHYEKYLKKNPNDRSSLEGLASIYLRDRKNEKALEYLERVVRVAPKTPKFQVKYAKVLESEGQFDKALDHYKVAAKYMTRKNVEKPVVVQKIKELKVKIKKMQAMARAKSRDVAKSDDENKVVTE